MKKRSEAKPKPKKTSAAERTTPMKYDDPEAIVLCGICDESNKVKDCSRDEKNVLECPACGAPIETMALRGDLPSKALLTDVKDEDEEDNEPDDVVSIGVHTGASSGTPTRGAKSNPFESKRENAKQDAMLKDFVSTAPAHEPPPKTYCTTCGSEWPIVKGEIWKNCGHTGGSVGSPRNASNYNPPAGTPRATVLGTTLHITRGKATFPTVAYGNFHVGPFGASVELMPGMDLIETAARIRADLRKIADDAFAEELAWYEQKLVVVKGET